MELEMAPEQTEEITLNWDKNFFEFGMAALSYRRPEENQYQYKLEGVDKQWYHAETTHSGRYSGLPDGTYTLRVRGSNNDGVWSKQEARLKVTVIGPFWRRTWFLLLVGLAVVGSVAGGVLRRIRAKEAQRRAAEERKRDLKRQIAERTAQLEAANKELEAFSYSVSHDLRAPLRHIVGFMELLEKKIGTALDEKSRHYMDAISEAIKKMGVLIDGLLSISRMGRHALSFQDVDLATLTSDVIRDLEPDFAGRDIKWRIGDLPVVSGDATLLRMVMDNLIANALKFTRPRQQAQIEIGSLPDQDSEAVIFVRDNGVGFDMAYVDKLFSVFQRLHHEDEFEGTGIGLATVHRIVARHGGRIWTEGKLDQGATFYFSLPQKQQGANHANP